MKTGALRIALAALMGVAGLASLPQDANAIPSLQLGIDGGYYDSATETVFSSGPSFALYAFLIPDADNLLGDTYYLSMAVTPSVSSATNLGSFTYNSNTVNVTADMNYGTPPVDTFFPDIGRHDIYPTYYKEVGFTFSSGSQSAEFNTQDHPSWGPQSGSGMYYKLFDIDASSLVSGYQIHFDLYNTNLKEKCTGGPRGGCTSVADKTQFAPFSHDAQSAMAIPEPETYAMLLAGLGLMGFIARRRRGDVRVV